MQIPNGGMSGCKYRISCVLWFRIAFTTSLFIAAELSLCAARRTARVNDLAVIANAVNSEIKTKLLSIFFSLC